DPVTSLALSGNSHGGTNVHADIGRRFGEQNQFGARINLVKGREDIGIDNFSGNRMLASAALDYRATRDLSFKFDLEHYEKEVSEQAGIAVPRAVNGAITLPSVPSARRNLAGEWQKYDAQATNMLFRTDYSISDNWAVLFEAGKAKTGRDRRFSQFQDYSLVTGEGTLRTFFANDQVWENENYRTELFGRLPGKLVTHEVSLGYTANRRSQDPNAQPSVDVAQNLFNPRDIAPIAAPAIGPGVSSTIKDRGWYLSDRILVGERWQAMVGVRGSDYESSSTASSFEADEVSPAVSLMYKPLHNVSVYASYLEGVEESGQAPANRANAGEILPPALTRQKEIGIKAEVAQGVLLQAAYFHIKRPSTTIDAANRFTLNGLARYRGIELAASGEVNRQLSLIGSALFLDAEQLNAANPATVGNVPDNTPERTASLFAEYRLQDVPGLAFSGGLVYVGKRPVNNENQAFVGGYTTLSLGARYATRIAGNRTVFQAVLDNATGRDYWSTAGNGLLGVGAPRTLKVVAKMDF
ncbi:MAG: TonB-dependent receptor, partial [Noviherbaspirillum sp.]